MLIMKADCSAVAPSVSSVYHVARRARSPGVIPGRIRGSGGPLCISNTFWTVIRPSVTGRIIFPPGLPNRDSLTGLQRLGKVGASALLWRPLSAARDHPTKQDRFEQT